MNEDETVMKGERADTPNERDYAPAGSGDFQWGPDFAIAVSDRAVASNKLSTATQMLYAFCEVADIEVAAKSVGKIAARAMLRRA